LRCPQYTQNGVWKSGYNSYHKTGIIINVKQREKHNHNLEMA